MTEAGEQSEDSDRGVEIEASGESDGRQEREELGGRDLEDIQHLRDIIKERESCWKTENPHFSRHKPHENWGTRKPKRSKQKGSLRERPLESCLVSAYSVDSISKPQASRRGSGMYFEFLFRRAHSRRRVERRY